MKKFISFLVVILFAACGDNVVVKKPTAPPPIDAPADSP
jgi:hypothetical protein